jgi:kynureninase
MSEHKASLDIFSAAGMHNLVAKGKMLSSYLLFILNEINQLTRHKIIEIITPLHEKQRGCQVSMLMLEDGKRIFDELTKAGIIADWREPNVIRVAPVPLYNTFEEVFYLGKILQQSLLG